MREREGDGARKLPGRDGSSETLEVRGSREREVVQLSAEQR